MKTRRTLKPKPWIATCTALALWVTAGASTFAAAPFQVTDRETVYALLHADGTVKKTIVVDWIQLKGKGKATVTDVGPLKNITNLSGSEMPIVRNDQIIWALDVNGERSLFYSGETQKPLPVNVSVTYFLNGQKVDATALAGKDGKVKVEVHLKNRSRQTKSITYVDDKGVKRTVKKELYTPLLALVSINIPTERFSDIQTGDALTVMMGKTMSATWMAMPNPEATVTLEMTGKNIELEPITITLIPKIPSITDIPINKDQLGKLAEGVGQLSSALVELEQGARQLADGNRQVQSSLKQLAEGLWVLVQANEAQTALVKQSLETNRQLLTLAQELAKAAPDNPELKVLVEGLQGQQQMLSLLTQGGEWQGQPFPGLQQTQEGLKTFRKGAEKLAGAAGGVTTGAGQLVAGIRQLSDGTAAMSRKLHAGLAQMNEGEAMMEAAKEAAAAYDTFLGKPQGATGEVRFILKTDPIKVKEAKKPSSPAAPPEPQEKRVSFFDKVIGFFNVLFERLRK